MAKGKRTKGQTTIYNTQKTKDRVTWTPLNTGGELRCFGRVNSSCSTSGTRRINVVTKPVISHKCEKNLDVLKDSCPGATRAYGSHATLCMLCATCFCNV